MGLLHPKPSHEINAAGGFRIFGPGRRNAPIRDLIADRGFPGDPGSEAGTKFGAAQRLFKGGVRRTGFMD